MDKTIYCILILVLACQCFSQEMSDCIYSDGDLSGELTSSNKQSGCRKLLNRHMDTEERTLHLENLATQFTCPSEGRFSDLSDPTCMKYFQCDKLSNGTFNTKSMKCPNSTFCSDIQDCSSTYSCPCNITTSTNYTTTISSLLTSSSLSTLYGCTVSFKEFQCAATGRFPDFSDITCRKYFLCSELRNGSFIETPYICKKSTFNPLTFRCSTSYICPCKSDQTTTEITSLGSSLTPSEGFTTSPTLTTISLCTSPMYEFNCSSKGRFPDLSDFSCQKYFLCSQLNNGSFIKTEYSCPNSRFNPPTEKCSIDYICPCTINSNTTSSHVTESISSSFTTSSVTTEPQISSTVTLNGSSTVVYTCNVSSDFYCSAVGRFADLSDSTCEKYFLCSQLHNGSFIKTEYKCPNSIFDPSTNKCSTKYICPCTATESSTISIPLTTSTTVSSTLSPMPTSSSISTTVTSNGLNTTVGCTISTNEFECSVTGRFPDLSDPSCRKYFLCSQLRNGTFIKTSYVCLKSTFNPLIFQCSASYICPCMIDSTSVTTTSSTSTFSEGFTKIPTSTSSYECAFNSNDIPKFKCTSVGRFPDYYDINCRKYFLCSLLHNGTYVQTPYSCPHPSCINPLTQKCSSSFICPCNYFSMS